MDIIELKLYHVNDLLDKGYKTFLLYEDDTDNTERVITLVPIKSTIYEIDTDIRPGYFGEADITVIVITEMIETPNVRFVIKKEIEYYGDKVLKRAKV